jgi:ceramide glucosyltransferase
MQTEFFNIFHLCVDLVCLCSAAYLIFVIIAVGLFKLKRKKSITPKKSIASSNFHPPVTILKPIYGLDPELTENLRSFCQQNYPEYQIIFGLHDNNDPAIPIVKKIMVEFNNIDVSYVIDSQIHGTNHKVSNLINMFPTAKYDYLLIADSDMRVSNDYLARVMSPFSDSKIGAVTCLYSGSARGKLTSTLNAMFINEWFLPSVLISRMIQPIKYCLGATMVVRRSVLNKIGGFNALSNYLADDYMLGKLVTDLGYKIHLSDFIVENIVEETSIKSLITHELRWARTLRRVEPLGYALTFLTDTFIISSLTAFVTYASTQSLIWSLLPVLLVLIARIILHNRIKKITGSKSAGSIWLIPLRDLLSFSIRIISFTGNSIQWRNNSFSVDKAGIIHTEQNGQLKLNDTDKIADLAASQDY